MKKKILFISESMGGGLRKHVVQLLENLNQEDFELYFIHGTETLDEIFLNKYLDLQKKCKLIPCDSLSREVHWKSDLKAFTFINKQIQTIKPDIVHCHSSKAGAIGRLAAKINRVSKIFYTPHAYSFLAPEFSQKKKSIFILIEKILSKYATTMTFNVSLGEKNIALKSRIDLENKFLVIYNGLPEINFPNKVSLKNDLNLESEWFIVGNNARLSEQKNPLLFMKIAKEVIEIDPSIHFVWVGDGPLEDKVIQFIKINSLNNNIHLLGFREDSEFIVAGYDLFLLTSNYEGLPYAPIEALRAGVPIIASNVTGNSEVVQQGETGYLVELTDINTFVKHILENKYKTTIDKKVVIKQFKQKFSINNMLNTIEKEYNKSN